MKKILLIITFLLLVSSQSYSQNWVSYWGKARVSDSNYFNIYKQLNLPLGLRTGATSTFGGSITFNSGYGVLTNNGNVNVTNGGAYLIDGSNINTIFGSLTSRNTWTLKNIFDTLFVGSTAKLTWDGSKVVLSENLSLPTLYATDIYGTRTIDFRGATSFIADSLKAKRISGRGDSLTIYANGGDYIALDGNSIKLYGNNFVALYGNGAMKLQTDDDSTKIKTDYIGGLTSNYVKEMRVNRLDVDTVVASQNSTFNGITNNGAEGFHTRAISEDSTIFHILPTDNTLLFMNDLGHNFSLVDSLLNSSNFNNKEITIISNTAGDTLGLSLLSFSNYNSTINLLSGDVIKIRYSSEVNSWFIVSIYRKGIDL